MNGGRKPVEFEKEPAQVQDFKKSTDCFRGVYGTDLKLTKKSERSHDVTSWTWETLGFRPIVPQNLPKDSYIVMYYYHARNYTYSFEKNGKYVVKCRWGGLIQ